MLKITRVLSATDTRDFVQAADDRWIAVPGSGDCRRCDRCDRKHEIHFLVELEDGSQALVGSGCSGSASMEVQTALRSSGARATRVAKAAAAAATKADLLERRSAFEAQVALLPTPPIAYWSEDRPCATRGPMAASGATFVMKMATVDADGPNRRTLVVQVGTGPTSQAEQDRLIARWRSLLVDELVAAGRKVPAGSAS